MDVKLSVWKMEIGKKLHQWFLNESTSWMDVKLVSEINLSLN